MIHKIYFAIIFYTLIYFPVKAQFPFLEGKEFSGTLMKVNDDTKNQAVVSFDASKTLLALTFLDPDSLLVRRSARSDYDRDIKKLTISVDLDESVFTVFKEQLQPGVNLTYTWYWLRNNIRTRSSDPWNYRSPIFNLSVESQYASYGSFNTDSSAIKIDKKTKTEAGINFGYVFTSEDNQIGVNSMYAAAIFVGGAFNSTIIDKKSNVVSFKETTTTGSQAISETKSVYFTNPGNFLLIKPKFDIAKRIYTFKSATNKPRFNSPRLYWVMRYSFNISLSENENNSNHSFFSGISLTTANNQTAASLIFELGNIDREDQFFAVKLFYGLPLK